MKKSESEDIKAIYWDKNDLVIFTPTRIISLKDAQIVTKSSKPTKSEKIISKVTNLKS
jgi:hypothetical protein